MDRDDCKLNNCGPFKLEVVGHYSNKFKLEKQTDKIYSIRYMSPGTLDVGKVYEIQVSGHDAENNKYESMMKLSVCR